MRIEKVFPSIVPFAVSAAASGLLGGLFLQYFHSSMYLELLKPAICSSFICVLMFRRNGKLDGSFEAQMIRFSFSFLAVALVTSCLKGRAKLLSSYFYMASSSFLVHSLSCLVFKVKDQRMALQEPTRSLMIQQGANAQMLINDRTLHHILEFVELPKMMDLSTTCKQVRIGVIEYAPTPGIVRFSRTSKQVSSKVRQCLFHEVTDSYFPSGNGKYILNNRAPDWFDIKNFQSAIFYLLYKRSKVSLGLFR